MILHIVFITFADVNYVSSMGTKGKSTKSTGRPKPVAAKAGLSRSSKRRYDKGGNLYCKGGKLK